MHNALTTLPGHHVSGSKSAETAGIFQPASKMLLPPKTPLSSSLAIPVALPSACAAVSDGAPEHRRSNVFILTAGHAPTLLYTSISSTRHASLLPLYRLYEDLCSKNIIMMSYECDYYFLSC